MSLRGSSHEGEVLVDGEQRPFCEVFGRGHERLVEQHLTLELGEGHQRLETGDGRRETGDGRRETRDGSQESGVRRRERRERSQETGNTDVEVKQSASRVSSCPPRRSSQELGPLTPDP